MDLDQTSDLTRRSLLASLGGVAGIALISHAVADEKEATATDRRPEEMSKVRKEFERLLPFMARGTEALRQLLEYLRLLEGAAWQSHYCVGASYHSVPDSAGEGGRFLVQRTFVPHYRGRHRQR